MPGRPNEATGSVRPGWWTLRAFVAGAPVRPSSAMRSASESPTGGGATSVPSPAGGIALLATWATGRRHRLAGTRQLAVVPDAPVRIAQYAAGMIDEAQRLFDVALAITRLGVILADQPPQRRAHLLVGGGRRNSQRFVKRGSHLSGGGDSRLMPESSGKSRPRQGAMRRSAGTCRVPRRQHSRTIRQCTTARRPAVRQPGAAA